jgi:hypothetical protein
MLHVWSPLDGSRRSHAWLTSPILQNTNVSRPLSNGSMTVKMVSTISSRLDGSCQFHARLALLFFFKTRMYPDLAIDSVLDLAHSFCKYEPIPTSLGVHNSKNNFRYSIYVWTARIDRADSPHFFCKHERILTSPGGRNSKTDFRCSSPLDYSSLFANTIYFYKVNVSCVYWLIVYILCT